MATQNDEIPAGWVKTPGLTSGSYLYTHPQHDGWKIYDAGAGGVITTYYPGGDAEGTAADLDEAFAWIAENVVPDNRRVDLDGNLPVRRIAYGVEPGIDGLYWIVKYTERVAETERLDEPVPSQEMAQREADGYNRVSLGLTPAEAHAIISSSVIVANRPLPGTVDPKRPIPNDEFEALVIIETAERAAQLAIQILGTARTGPVADVDRKVNRAIHLLSHTVGLTTNRTCTAVKRQEVSDRISAAARAQIADINCIIDEALEARR